MSTVAVFPESGTSTRQAPPEPHPASEPVARETKAAEPTHWREIALDLLVQGASVTDAMRHAGYSSAAFYKACTRHPEFRVEAARARNAYRAQVAEELHNAGAYARMLVGSIMRDEALPGSLRLRAALAILNRKGDRWLPSSIPADGMDAVDTVDTVDNVGGHITLDIVDIAGNAHTTDTVDTTGTAEVVDTMDTVDTVDTLDTGCTIGPHASQSLIPAASRFHSPATASVAAAPRKRPCAAVLHPAHRRGGRPRCL